MREYEDREREVVTRRECVQVRCDMCKRVAEYPEQEHLAFEWGSVGSSGGTIKADYCMYGDLESEECDLCYECSMQIIQGIGNGNLKRLFDKLNMEG